MNTEKCNVELQIKIPPVSNFIKKQVANVLYRRLQPGAAGVRTNPSRGHRSTALFIEMLLKQTNYSLISIVMGIKDSGRHRIEGGALPGAYILANCQPFVY